MKHAMSWMLLGTLMAVPALLMAQEAPKAATETDTRKERERAVARAKTLLADKLGVEESKIAVESAKAATWPDAALGCPEKDHMYAQVVTSGWAVVLESQGKTHEVHVGRGRAVICPSKAQQK